MKPENQYIVESRKMADTLVQLGLVSRYVWNDTTRQVAVFWSPRGEVFRDELIKAHDKLAKGKGKDGMMELVALWTFIITHCRPDSPS